LKIYNAVAMNVSMAFESDEPALQFDDAGIIVAGRAVTLSIAPLHLNLFFRLSASLIWTSGDQGQNPLAEARNERSLQPQKRCCKEVGPRSLIR
jgi:hypothetical protein